MQNQITVQDARTYVTKSGFELQAPATELEFAEFIYRNQHLLPDRQDGELIPNLDAAAAGDLRSISVEPYEYGIGAPPMTPAISRSIQNFYEQKNIQDMAAAIVDAYKMRRPFSDPECGDTKFVDAEYTDATSVVTAHSPDDAARKLTNLRLADKRAAGSRMTQKGSSGWSDWYNGSHQYSVILMPDDAKQFVSYNGVCGFYSGKTEELIITIDRVDGQPLSSKPFPRRYDQTSSRD